jgi:hypothetical protein
MKLNELFDKGARRMNREILSIRIENAQPYHPTTKELREIDQACNRFLAIRERAKKKTKKLLTQQHTL